MKFTLLIKKIIIFKVFVFENNKKSQLHINNLFTFDQNIKDISFHNKKKFTLLIKKK